MYSEDDVSRLRICNRHFTSADFIEPRAKEFGKRFRLKPNAVPSRRVPGSNADPLSIPPSVIPAGSVLELGKM